MGAKNTRLHSFLTRVTHGAHGCIVRSLTRCPSCSSVRHRSLEPLAEIRGALKKLKHTPGFLSKIFDNRCKQLYPRDLLVAYVPSKRNPAKSRAVGVLRRSFSYDKAKGCSTLTIDFVWVMPEARSCGCGRGLMAAGLVAGKPKDVHLQVAGSEENKTAVALYSSLGFTWDEAMPDKTEMILPAAGVEAAVAEASARRGSTANSQPGAGQPQEEQQQQRQRCEADHQKPPKALEDAAGVQASSPERPLAPASDSQALEPQFADITDNMANVPAGHGLFAGLQASKDLPLRLRERASGERAG